MRCSGGGGGGAWCTSRFGSSLRGGLPYRPLARGRGSGGSGRWGGYGGRGASLICGRLRGPFSAVDRRALPAYAARVSPVGSADSRKLPGPTSMSPMPGTFHPEISRLAGPGSSSGTGVQPSHWVQPFTSQHLGSAREESCPPAPRSPSLMSADVGSRLWIERYWDCQVRGPRRAKEAQQLPFGTTPACAGTTARELGLYLVAGLGFVTCGGSSGRPRCSWRSSVRQRFGNLGNADTSHPCFGVDSSGLCIPGSPDPDVDADACPVDLR